MISFVIIVPTRNSFRLLPALIHSLQIQTYPIWRVQFIDGQSESEHINYLTSICTLDSRFSWKPQIVRDTGIFGAMNEGLNSISTCDDQWILFWGSDDRASDPFMLASIVERINSFSQVNNKPDLVICGGAYYRCSVDSKEKSFLTRRTNFKFINTYRKSMFLGLTPPHQATFFGVGALKLLSHFSTDLMLAADLDYFLKLSEVPGINVLVLDNNVVLIGDSGISNQNTWQRLIEVSRVYHKTFKSLWFIPFVFRYLRRIQSKLERI
jgi:glycosyltransferase involved in cell wall biosynthesis